VKVNARLCRDLTPIYTGRGQELRQRVHAGSLLTEQQALADKNFKSGGSLKINAFTGTSEPYSILAGGRSFALLEPNQDGVTSDAIHSAWIF
jgi:hypothetical protein